MPHPVVHFEVLGKDADALSRFYGDTFEWEMQSVMPTYAMARPVGEDGIAGGVGAAPEGAEGHVTFYIEVEDLPAALERIAANGGRTVQPPMDVPDGPAIALFADPEGHVVGLVKG
jgi:predicted enzyme related to lactoylglutathione lyase